MERTAEVEKMCDQGIGNGLRSSARDRPAGRVAVNPSQAQHSERPLVEKRGTCCQGIHRRARIMEEARQRQCHGADSATGLLLRFEYVHFKPGSREDDSGCEAVWSRSNNVSARHGTISPVNHGAATPQAFARLASVRPQSEL